MAEKQKVLIVDDEPDIRDLLTMSLSQMNLDSDAVGTLTEARTCIDDGPFDLCLTDMRLPDGDGIDLVRHIQKTRPELPVAIITAYGNVETAVEALKAGAYDFVSKPLKLDELRNLVASILKLSRNPHERRSRNVLLGESDAMRRIRGMVVKLARSQAPVYIRGESGTGKELVARLIHEKSARADGPFVPINCGAVPPDLMESEFFGHVKGSFTGAGSDKPGLFQAAEGGTLFLDEVVELPLAMQVKLLRAIQERSVRRVGAQREEPVNVRILSASQQPLLKEVEAGRFRQDLYYRIHVIEISVPPLRQRAGDLPQLIDHLLERIGEKLGGEVNAEQGVYRLLDGYGFPGNVRELENILERAAALSESDTITARDLDFLPAAADAPAAVSGGYEPGDEPLEDFLAKIEKQALVDALARAGSNKTAAAKLLGMSFRSFRYKLDKYDLSD
ncbi:MAG: sigma-54 dependent transcriptional regulator [Gammaproteobacteria bacterium]|nr:sigma-54 dependent transcriptional regulator [Gammaproteobacteria bacterium]